MLALKDAFDDESDSIPNDLTQFALDAFQWRLIDEELAAITFDSANEELVGIRGTATLRHSMRFEGSGIAVAVSMMESSVVVSIEPAATYQCRIEGPRVALDVETDEHGQLAVSHSQLPIRLIVDVDGGRFVTPWITG